jgi:hypothetical protein
MDYTESFYRTLQIRSNTRLIHSKKSLISGNHITKYLTLRYKLIQFFTKRSNRRRSPAIKRVFSGDQNFNRNAIAAS